jgi:cytoskeleton protein RodZ
MDSLQMTNESMLQAARLASGLSIEELSKKTLVRSGILKDLENYDCASCGGIAYARGHLRNIAKVLKIDSKELIADFETKINLETRPIFDRLADNNVTQKIAQKSGLSFKSIGFGVATVAILGGVVFLAMQNSGTAVVQKTSPTTSAQSVSTISNGIDLTFVGVYGKSWIGITDKDENVVFDGILYQGETKKFTNPTELKVTIGNGAAVSYVLNGQDKGVAGKLGEVVHLDLKVGA